MTKWHVKPNGEPGKCSASKRPCKYGDKEHHYNSKEECLQALEADNASKAAKTDGQKALSHDKIYFVNEFATLQYGKVAGSVLSELGRGQMLEELFKGHATNQSYLAKKIYAVHDRAAIMANSLSHSGIVHIPEFHDVMNSLHDAESSLFTASNGDTQKMYLRPTNKLVVLKDGWRYTGLSYKYKKPNGRFDTSPMTITRQLFTNGEDLVSIDSADYNGEILIKVTNKNNPESTMNILKSSKDRLVLSSDNDEISSKKLNGLVDHLVIEGKYGYDPIVNISEFGPATIDYDSNHIVLTEKEVDSMLSK